MIPVQHIHTAACLACGGWVSDVRDGEACQQVRVTIVRCPQCGTYVTFGGEWDVEGPCAA